MQTSAEADQQSTIFGPMAVWLAVLAVRGDGVFVYDLLGGVE